MDGDPRDPAVLRAGDGFYGEPRFYTRHPLLYPVTFSNSVVLFVISNNTWYITMYWY